MHATSQGTSNLLRTNVFQHFITYKHTCMPINAKKTYECGYISPISYHHFFIIYYVRHFNFFLPIILSFANPLSYLIQIPFYFLPYIYLHSYLMQIPTVTHHTFYWTLSSSNYLHLRLSNIMHHSYSISTPYHQLFVILLLQNIQNIVMQAWVLKKACISHNTHHHASLTENYLSHNCINQNQLLNRPREKILNLTDSIKIW